MITEKKKLPPMLARLKKKGKLKIKKEDIEKYATDEEKKILKEAGFEGNAKRNTFNLIIHTDNAAFEPDPNTEIHRILSDLESVEWYGKNNQQLFDGNGNVVGYISYNLRNI